MCIVYNNTLSVRDIKKLDMRVFKLFSLMIIAGMIGGAIVLFGLKNNTIVKEIVINESAHKPKLVNYTSSNKQIDLTKAAEFGTQSVVHIRAEESKQKARERREQRYDMNSPLYGFRDLPFGEFFGFGNNDQFYRKKGGGSGVIISKDGYIVTNNHVVDFADKIIVTLPNNKEYTAQKVGTDPSTDLAVIKIEENNLPVLKFADSESVKVGQWVIAVGNPFDYLTSSVTAGIVSAKNRKIDIIQAEGAHEEFIQTDAAVNPGNSGGALIDENGKLVGITTAIATPTGSYAGYSFAIPSNLMLKVTNKLIEEGKENLNRATLGLSVITVNEDIQNDKNLPIDYGVYVDEVNTGSSAEFAGILPGDVIVKANKSAIHDFEDLNLFMKSVKINDFITLTVLRDNKYKDITVKLRTN